MLKQSIIHRKEWDYWNSFYSITVFEILVWDSAREPSTKLHSLTFSGWVPKAGHKTHRVHEFWEMGSFTQRQKPWPRAGSGWKPHHHTASYRQDLTQHTRLASHPHSLPSKSKSISSFIYKRKINLHNQKSSQHGRHSHLLPHGPVNKQHKETWCREILHLKLRKQKLLFLCCTCPMT